MYETTDIFSDVHIGDDECEAELLLNFLEASRSEKKVIVGDLYWSRRAASPAQEKLIAYLRQHREEIICVDGNHDTIEENLVGKTLGIAVRRQYNWTDPVGRKCRAIHGHREFHKLCFVFSEPWVDMLFLWLICFLKKFDLKTLWVTRLIDWFHEKFSSDFNRQALAYAKRYRIDRLFCGHTHREIYMTVEENGRTIEYYNLGSWVEGIGVIVTIDRRGIAHRHLVDVKKERIAA